jgi:hypothetical protein
MEIEIEEVGPSSRPFRYVSQQQWRQPPPPPPPPGMMGGPTSSAGVLGPGEAGAPPPASVAAQQNQFDSEKVPQTLVSEVRPFLRVANDVEAESPRVAYLCKSRAAYTPASLSLFFLPLHGTSARARDLFVEMPGGKPAGAHAVEFKHLNGWTSFSFRF